MKPRADKITEGSQRPLISASRIVNVAFTSMPTNRPAQSSSTMSTSCLFRCTEVQQLRACDTPADLLSQLHHIEVLQQGTAAGRVPLDLPIV